MRITLVHSTSGDDGSPLDLTLELDADRPPAVGDYLTVDGDAVLTLQVVERDWAQDLRSVTVHLRDPEVSGALTSQQRVETLARAGWSRTVALPR